MTLLQSDYLTSLIWVSFISDAIISAKFNSDKIVKAEFIIYFN